MLLFVFFVAMSFVRFVAAQIPDTQIDKLYARVIGTWELNLAKSSYPNGGAPKKQTIYYEKLDGAARGIKFSETIVNAEGKEQKIASNQYLDGREYGGLARVPVDEFNMDTLGKRDGKITTRNTANFTPDGKVMTFTYRSVAADGNETVTRVQVFDRVGP